MARVILYGASMVKELSTSQVAARLNVSAITVRLWCRRGLFKNAREVETPRGPVWMIPVGDVEGFTSPKIGRPPKGVVLGSPKEKSA